MERTPGFKTEFESQASEKGFLGELWEFLKMNKKLWLVPILAALLITGLLVLFSSTAALPFIYTLF